MSLFCVCVFFGFVFFLFCFCLSGTVHLATASLVTLARRGESTTTSATLATPEVGWAARQKKHRPVTGRSPRRHTLHILSLAGPFLPEALQTNPWRNAKVHVEGLQGQANNNKHNKQQAQGQTSTNNTTTNNTKISKNNSIGIQSTSCFMWGRGNPIRIYFLGSISSSEGRILGRVGQGVTYFQLTCSDELAKGLQRSRWGRLKSAYTLFQFKLT